MYTDFYNLKEKPFNLTPSSRFLYLGESHKEALALLTYGVVERKGFILLTGEVGTGKTTMVHALLSNLDENVQCIHLSNPLLNPQEFIDYLAYSVFEKRVHFKSKAEFLIEFENHLQWCLQHNKNFVLIIDEAQKLSFELLEEVRLLSNMETADEKLINIFLVGQPELNEHLSEARCRPLLQRISIRHHISPLDPEETGNYIMTRMRVAGSRDGGKIFPKSAIKMLHQCSMGYPRMINILADNALLLGYSRDVKKISSSIIKECFDDMKLDGFYVKGAEKKEDRRRSDESRPVKRSRFWIWAVLFIFFLILALGFMTPQGKSLWMQTVAFFQNPSTESPAEEKSRPKEEMQQDAEDPPEVNPDLNSRRDHSPIGEEDVETRPVSPLLSQDTESHGIMPQNEPEPEPEPVKIVTVKQGDTLLEMAARVYGYADENVLDSVLKHNPQITDGNWIEVGQRIVFPELNKESKRTGQETTYTVHIASYTPFDNAGEMFQQLVKDGYEAYILPVYDPGKGKIFRITLGSFKSRNEAEAFAAALLRRGLSEYAETIRLEMR